MTAKRALKMTVTVNEFDRVGDAEATEPGEALQRNLIL